MKKQHVKVTLFGAAGKRQVNITSKGGFFTRHIKAPREAAPFLFAPEPTEPTPATSKPAPVKPKSAPKPQKSDEVALPTLLEVLKWMEASKTYSDWFITDEILRVATDEYKMKFNHTTLLDALRLLYKEGCLEHRLNRFDQHTFRLIENQENNLKNLLGEVDAILTKGGAS